MYNHDINTLAQQLVPPHLRLPKNIAWAKLLSGALEHAYNLFVFKIAEWAAITRYNGQVCYMQQALREAFCPNSPDDIELSEPLQKFAQIYVHNVADNADELYMYNVADENNPLYEDIYLYNSLDFIKESDFYILINNLDLWNNATLAGINNLVAMYAVAGNKWKLILNADYEIR